MVLLLGAGATVADVATKPRKERPPLDRHFFSEARLTHSGDANAIRRYVRATYDYDIFGDSHDRLESVMTLIYADVYNPLLETDALEAFRRLVTLFTRRLAATTNGIAATNKRLVYRIVADYLGSGVRPENLTIITFNQDIQVEKMLSQMSTVTRWGSLAANIFAFPHLYGFDVNPPVTRPPAGSNVFVSGGDAAKCIRLLKLHGSLNWLSAHTDREPTRSAMFNPTRKINITPRQIIDPRMTLRRSKRSMFTLPVVIPPVTNKASVIHHDMAPIWQLAEQKLREAHDIVIFGYSCPVADVESANQLRRSQSGRSTPATLAVIDPAPTIAQRYITLLDAPCLHYYRSGHAFLSRAVTSPI